MLPALIICLEVLQLLCHVSGEPFLPFFAHAGSAAARSAAWRTVHLRGSIKPSRTPLRITIDQPILATIVVVVNSCRDEWHAHESRPPRRMLVPDARNVDGTAAGDGHQGARLLSSAVLLLGRTRMVQKRTTMRTS